MVSAEVISDRVNLGQAQPLPELEQVAVELARGHHEFQVSNDGTPLTASLDETKKIIGKANQFFRNVNIQELSLSIVEEWILDNDHILQQAIRQVKEDLPNHFYHELPKLITPDKKNLPRIYDLAYAIIQHDQAQLSLERLERFILSYQQSTPLKMGEIWALPAMLRFGILQGLAVILSGLTQQKLSDTFAYPLSPTEDVADDKIVANSISSLRTLATTDWKDFFETVSLVEGILKGDPAGVYLKMDFDTRDRYRKQVEKIAMQAGRDEWEVAHIVVQMAQEALDSFESSPYSIENDELPEESSLSSDVWEISFHLPRSSHIGYYLIARGLADLERNINIRLSSAERASRWSSSHPTLTYLGSILLTFLSVMSVLLVFAAFLGATPVSLIFLAVLGGIPVSAFVVNLVNAVTTHLKKPHVLPKLDLSEGVPKSCATLVVIPALLSSQREVDSLLQQIKLHYLRNPGENLYFGLLTDFLDAPQQTMPNDDEWVQRAVQGIENLNTKYTRDGFAPFFLLHRERRWNPSEEIWMGWERKRGKLQELNRLILGHQDTSFVIQVGDLEALSTIRYVITLDADTILPRNNARRLIATLAHPLNRAEFDPDTQRVIAGYTILQPRIEILPARSNQSLFTRIFVQDTGLDLYTLAVSDVYQDLFGEGIFVGKGIYEVAPFERSLENRVPENALLSHDLFEGIHGRAGLVTDIVVIEDYPPNYLVEIQRLHRWVRGDWQLIPWLFAQVPSASEGWARNRLSLIDQWKIFDNLRRSLLAPLLLLFLVAGWTVFPGSPVIWTLVGILALGVPSLVSIIDGVISLFYGVPLKRVLDSTQNNLLRWLLALIFLPFEALVNLDAIVTTLIRVIFDRRGMLQWTTAAQTARRWSGRIKLKTIWQQMAMAFLLGLLLGIMLLWLDPAVLWIASPFLILWMFSPQIAYLINRPIHVRVEKLSEKQIVDLRALARLTWLFFEQFIGPEDHWLPPDHYQESPRGVIAHRTSPTNIGLGLLSTLAAYDFGYIELMDVVARLRATFETLERLEQYRGHFLNWYDTRTLHPLTPRYISTVDSGNLAASLVALGEGCHAIATRPLLRRESWEGLGDAISMIYPLVNLPSGDNHEDRQILVTYLTDFCQHLQNISEQPQTWHTALLELSDNLQPYTGEKKSAFTFNLMELDERLINFAETYADELGAENLRRLRIYTKRIHAQLEGIKRQVSIFMPWLAILDKPPAILVNSPCPPAVFPAWERLKEILQRTTLTLREIQEIAIKAREPLEELTTALDDLNCEPAQREEAHKWLERLQEELVSAAMAVKILEIGLHELRGQSEKFAYQMDFSFLYNIQRKVFHLGYNLELDRLDNNYYDLLASEARIASIFAIAKGDVPQTHWLHLSRPVTRVAGMLSLVSWSATMFEYLMPPLLLRDYAGTLLNHSAGAAVDHQIEYGKEKDVPWGISESGYYHFDNSLNYQYRAFGVPGLGFKRGLEDDLVVAPYASLLALPYRAGAVVKNYEHLKTLGMLGTYGLYEAIDFTKDRLQPGDKHAIIKSYMAHHQGMLFLAIVNYLKHNIMVNRFHADPHIQSVELLLQEQIPVDAPLENTDRSETNSILQTVVSREKAKPWRVRVRTAQPRPHLLSNGRYSVLITSAGGGFSRWRNFDLTRWRQDTTLDHHGTWIYIKDLDHPKDPLWSVTHQPTGKTPKRRDIHFYPHKAEFRRRDGDISAVMDVTVPPTDDLEIRRITITNHSEYPRHLRLSSYAEIILTLQATDERHPAFNKLFIENSFLAELNALIFRRRPRKASEEPIFLAHALVMERGKPKGMAFESDRNEFLGRGRTPRQPQALMDVKHGLTGSTGSVLDPIASLSCNLELQPHSHIQLAFLIAAGDSSEALKTLIQRYQYWHTIDRAFDEASTHAELELRQLGIKGDELATIQNLLSLMVYSYRTLRSPAELLASNRRSQSGLWGYGISGDYPILLVTIRETDDLQLVQEVLHAHAYWRNRQFMVDLVILNEQGTNYGQELQGQLYRLFSTLRAEPWLNRRGGIFILYTDRIEERDKVLLRTAARAVIEAGRGSLAEQLKPLQERPSRLPVFAGSEIRPKEIITEPLVARPENLQFDNGLGGFSPDGREYLIYLKERETTPLPWVNVIANEEFGFIVTESGSSTTWAANSGENRLTPWSNDPVTDPPGEAIYLRDEETADVWTPTPLPIRQNEPYLIRHGAGYSNFEHNSFGLKQQMRVFAAPDDPVKIIQLRVENLLDRPRRVTATYYAEWVLGVHRSDMQHYIVPEYDDKNQALLARNFYNEEFSERVAFVASSKQIFGLTADRAEFLGRSGSYKNPAGLRRIGLAGSVEAGQDPCAAIQVHLDLPSGGFEEFYYLLGQGDNREHTLQLIQQYRDPNEVARAWDELTKKWDQILDVVKVKTPDPAMDLLLNRWVLYQALSCRIWGRSAFYQSSGAFGFRDQLQDVMALMHSAPELARAHILRAASHQFEEGDVLHWWHPPSGRGVRTRISDDLIWLPYVTASYIEATGDLSILDEQVPSKRGELLHPDEEERYSTYSTTEETLSLLEHCYRALERGVTSGPHGLPLIGTGDWNDGMNRVGVEGHGESIWLAWFLNVTLKRFADICDQMGKTAQAEVHRQRAAHLIQKLEENAWDGNWYLRAFYDDGTPLGSAKNRECQIDAISQSWAVLSGDADPDRARQAMQAVLERLVQRENRLILLLAPPFSKTSRDPGYIRGYLPGIRENGGQYTHAAIWTVWAFAELGEGDIASELFSLLNPIYHTDQPEKVRRYKTEPYVIAADVYSIPPHVGRGGWTWYTGSSGWMYRLGLEAILGLRKVGDALVINPCIPSQWEGFQITYRYEKSEYVLEVRNSEGVSQGVKRITLDGKEMSDGTIPLLDDGKNHQVIVEMGNASN